jgi:hypothetical protein
VYGSRVVVSGTKAKAATVALIVLALGALSSSSAADPARAKRDPLREVLFVGNNWDGTADVIRVHHGGSRGSTSSPTSTSGWPRSRATPSASVTSWPFAS